MLTNRYINALLTTGIVEELKQNPIAYEQCEQAMLASEQRDRAASWGAQFAEINLAIK
jgi:hypothetical protein